MPVLRAGFRERRSPGRLRQEQFPIGPDIRLIFFQGPELIPAGRYNIPAQIPRGIPGIPGQDGHLIRRNRPSPRGQGRRKGRPSQPPENMMPSSDARGLRPGKAQGLGQLRMLPLPFGAGISAAAIAPHGPHRQRQVGRQRMPPTRGRARIRPGCQPFPQRQFRAFPPNPPRPFSTDFPCYPSGQK